MLLASASATFPCEKCAYLRLALTDGNTITVRFVVRLFLLPPLLWALYTRLSGSCSHISPIAIFGIFTSRSISVFTANIASLSALLRHKRPIERY